MIVTAHWKKGSGVSIFIIRLIEAGKAARGEDPEVRFWAEIWSEQQLSFLTNSSPISLFVCCSIHLSVCLYLLRSPYVAFVLESDPLTAPRTPSQLGLASLQKPLRYFRLKSPLLNGCPCSCLFSLSWMEGRSVRGEASYLTGHVESRRKVERMYLKTKPPVGAGDLAPSLCVYLYPRGAHHH